MCINHLFTRSNFYFLHNSQWITLPTDHVYSYTLFALICCIRLSYDWSFRLYHHITDICYFVASNLFLSWYDWSLWRYFVLLQNRFTFSAMSMFSRVRFCFFITWSVGRVVFSPHFCLLVISILLMLVYFFLMAVISPPSALVHVIFEPLYPFYQPLLSGRIWHKVNF